MDNGEYKKIIFSCFPRSGHHLLLSIINNILAKHFAKQIPYCEFYNCCNKFPCEKNSLICKNHDFDEKLPYNPNFYYIVQYRKSPYQQIQSFYNCAVKYFKYNKSIIEFIREKKKYYINWINKWVFKTDVKNMYFLEYEELIKNPKIHVLNILKNIYPMEKIKMKIINEIILDHNIEIKNKWDLISEEDFNKLISVNTNKIYKTFNVYSAYLSKNELLNNHNHNKNKSNIQFFPPNNNKDSKDNLLNNKCMISSIDSTSNIQNINLCEKKISNIRAKNIINVMKLQNICIEENKYVYIGKDNKVYPYYNDNNHNHNHNINISQLDPLNNYELKKNQEQLNKDLLEQEAKLKERIEIKNKLKEKELYEEKLQNDLKNKELLRKKYLLEQKNKEQMKQKQIQANNIKLREEHKQKQQYELKLKEDALIREKLLNDAIKKEQRKQMEEKKKQDEFKKLDELRKKEDIRKKEELNKQIELKKQEEFKKIEEKKRKEELKKQEELKKNMILDMKIREEENIIKNELKIQEDKKNEIKNIEKQRRELELKLQKAIEEENKLKEEFLQKNTKTQKIDIVFENLRQPKDIEITTKNKNNRSNNTNLKKIEETITEPPIKFLNYRQPFILKNKKKILPDQLATKKIEINENPAYICKNNFGKNVFIINTNKLVNLHNINKNIDNKLNLYNL